MNLTQETAFTTLGWIKPELDATLKQALQSLERFAANSSDVQAMRDCANDLHTAHGTLHMVELYGAALVAEEMERVAHGLLDGSIAPREDVYSVLMRGFLQLPDYLERLQVGHKDIPIVLLPLLNDLRAARGDKLLSESVLFAPNIDAALPTPARNPLDAEVLRSTAKGLRNDYQHALLRWIREPASAAPLTRLAQISDTFYAGCRGDAARRVWWVAGAAIEGLQSDAIEASVAIKLLFGKLDREIKRLIDDGEGVLGATQTKDLVKNLLYYIAHGKTRGPRAEEVIAFYNLDKLLPTREELEHAHGSISGHNRALLDTVATGIREDLQRVKDTLNVYLHSSQRNPADLAPQAETLGSLADTFGMLGMGVPRQRVLEQRSAIDRIVAGEAEANENNLLDIAGGLLVVEASLEEHISRLGVVSGAADEATSQVPRAEVERLLHVLMHEALVNVSKVKQGIVAFIEGPWDHSHLEPAPALLTEVGGALDMLTLHDAVKPVNVIGQYIKNELLELRRVPDRSHIDALANAVASIEYYIEAVGEQRGDRERLLDLVRESLASLGYWPEIRSSAEAAAAYAREPAAEAETFTVPAAPAADAAPMIDEELRQVFLDEMDDETANLRKHFPLWRADPEETENLMVVRRSFHTLKGSGRLVGAVALGDFAWKVENMLNRVLDRSITASPPLLQVVSYAIGALPRFRSELSRHERSSLTMDGFAAAVDRLCAGDTSPVDESQFTAPAVAAPVATAVETAPAEAPILETQPIETSIHETASVEPLAAAEPVELHAGAEPAIELPRVLELVPIDDETAHPVKIELPPSMGWIDESARYVETKPPAGSAHSTDAQPAADAAEPVFAAAHESEHAAEARQAPAPAPQVDQLLLEVLRGEADTHLAVLDAAVAHGRWQPLTVREDLVRAVHTLNGAFAMVEAPQIVQMLAPLEGWLARSRNANRALDSEGVSLLDAASTRVKLALAALEGGWAMPDTAALVAQIAALRDGVHAGEAIVTDVEPAHEAPEPETHEFLHPDAGSENVAPVEADIHPQTIEHLDATAEAEAEAVTTQADIAASTHEFAETPAQATEVVEPAATSSESAQLSEDDHVSMAELVAPVSASSPIDTATVLPHLDDIESALAAYEALLAHPVAPRDVEEHVHPETDLASEHTAVADEAVPGVIEEVALPPVETDEPASFAQVPHDEHAVFEHPESVAVTVGEISGSADSELHDHSLHDELREPAPVEPKAPELLATHEAVTEPEPSAPQTFAHEAHAAEPAPSPDGLHPVPDIDEDLLDVFVLEAQEILDRSDALLLRLRGAPGDTGLLDELRRDLHTIKGGANMSALAPIGDLGHAMESLLEGAVEHGRALDGAMLHAIEQGFDTLHSQVQAAAARKATTMPSALIARIEALSRGESDADAEDVSADVAVKDETAHVVESDSVAEPVPMTVTAAEDAVEAVAASSQAPVVEEPAQSAIASQTEAEPVFAGTEYIRVRAAQLDTMVNGASEVAIYRSRLEQQISSYRANVVEMESTVSRLREQMRRLELEAEAQMASRFQREGDVSSFDPLELDRFSQLQQLSRSLAESMSDMVAIQVGFDQLTRQSESLLMQQSRVSADLQESLMRARMVPFDSLVPALRRTLRQTATSLGKEALLRVDGAQGEMDRTLLERMKAPIEHMLRNALAHGIEDVPDRLAAGKPVEGSVRIALSREATETVLRISDDGRGLDRTAIRKRAIERGLLAPDSKIGDRELDAFILASGFSTATSLTQLSGRGIGMDVVANQIKQLGGSLAIESNPGRGAAFTVRLPFTLGVTQAIIVRLGDKNYAIPMNAVQGAVHITRSELDARMAAEEPEYVYAGESFPILDLAPQLGEISATVAGDSQVPLLIVRSGDQHAAVRVDHVLGSREIVVKPVGPQITSVPGILGATIMGDGSVIMILDLAPLLRRVAALRAQGVPVVVAPAAARVHRRRLVMVVDDSITMRKAASRVLEREEMDVVTAKDGIDAIEKLADRLPDIVLLDIEMPRMDGYQFAEHMKGDPRTARVPIIMITSRTGEKHRARAQEIGVEGYLGKPYQDVELIKNIRELLDAAR